MPAPIPASWPDDGPPVTPSGSPFGPHGVAPFVGPGRPVDWPARGTEPLLSAVPDDLRQHRARFGPCPPADGRAAERLLADLDTVGLTGRGGGHFPVAAKWRAVRATAGRRVAVANAAEGEPASAKDATLVQHRPHLVLDGLALAAATIGASEAVVWLSEAAHASRRILMRALAERAFAGLADPPIRVLTGPEHFLSGESSAVEAALAGGPALPAFHLAPAATRGLLVQNAESLARVALLARAGAGGFTETALATVVTPGRRRVVELAGPPTVADVLAHAGVALTPAPGAVLVGGYGGSWLAWHRVAGTPATPAGLRGVGASWGAGLLVPLPTHACGLAETAPVVSYLAASSARQCGPCLFGLAAIAETFQALAARRAGRRDVKRLRTWLEQVRGRGACHHPDGAAQLVGSALATFADDVAAHLRGRCLAGRRQPAAHLLPVPSPGGETPG